jgi:hypothetical protein
MGGRRSAVAFLVGIRAAEGLALLAAVGGVFAVSRQLERDLTTKLGPLVVPQGQQAAPPVVVAALPPRHATAPGGERQRLAVPSTLSRRADAAALASAREAPGATQRRSVVPSGGRTRPGRPPQPPSAPLPVPPAPAPTPEPAPASTVSPQPGGSLAGSSSPPSEAPTTTPVPVQTPSAAASPRPGWGRGDRNHTHTGPSGAPPTTVPSATPPAEPTNTQGTSTAGSPQPDAGTNHGPKATPPEPPQADLGAPPATAVADSPLAAGTHDNDAAASSRHNR